MEQQESTKPIMTKPPKENLQPTPPSPLLTPSTNDQDPPNHHHHKFTTFAGHRFTNPAYITLALHISPDSPTRPLPPFQRGETPHPNHLIPIGDRLIETCYRAALHSGQIPLLPAGPETEDLALQLSNRELGQRAKRLGIDERVCYVEEGEPETRGVPGGEVSGMQAAEALKGLWGGVWMDCLGSDDEGAMEAVREVMGRCGVVLPSGREFLRDWCEGMGREVEVVGGLRLAMDEAFR